MELEVINTITRVNRSINRIQNVAMPKIKSIAAERAAKHAAEFAAKQGLNALDDPIPAVFGGKKTRHRLGWIYWEWDERADILRKGGDVQAKMQIQGRASTEKARREQREAIHRQIYGTTETQGVTPAVPYIIRPSRRLRTQKSIKGVPLKVDSFGNLRNYRSNLRKMMADPKGRFFHIPLGSNGSGGHRGSGLKLKPGLYFRKTRVRRYKRNRATKRKGGPYGPNKTRETVSIITVLTYHHLRQYRSKWEFKKKTTVAMQRKYKSEFNQLLQKELLKLKK